MKTVLLLLSTDRVCIPLIRYLVLEGKRFGWKTCVGSMFDVCSAERIKQEKVTGDIIFITITDFRQCDHAIRKSDLVICMAPDVMLLQVADSCITHDKTLITPGRLNGQLVQRKLEVEESNTLVLSECGFSPGLDHITAKKAIDNIQARGGRISSFKTYSGSLIAESCIDNPWEFKLTEPALDVINVGKGNNRYLIDGQVQHIPHHCLFKRSAAIDIKGVRQTVAVHDEDALYLQKLYGLAGADTVIKGKIFRKGFDTLWDLVIQLGLTNTALKIDLFENRSFKNLLRSLLPYTPTTSLEASLLHYSNAGPEEIEKLKWLGWFDGEWPEGYQEITPSTILQYLLEKKFTMLPDDRDCIIMRHELDYVNKNHRHKFTATLVSDGEDQRNSALAKAIGLTTGAAAKAVLLGDINVKGIHTPVKKEIYDPILNELDDLGVAFQIEETKVHEFEATNTFAHLMTGEETMH